MPKKLAEASIPVVCQDHTARRHDLPVAKDCRLHGGRDWPVVPSDWPVLATRHRMDKALATGHRMGKALATGHRVDLHH